METVKKVWNWIVWSSEDPQKISLTLKAGIPAVILVSSVFGYHVPDAYFTGAADQITNVVVAGAGFLSALVAAYGFLRKIGNS